MRYNIADIIVDLDIHYPHLQGQITDYIYEGDRETNIRIRYTEKIFDEIHEKYPLLDKGMIEYICLGGEYYNALVHFNGMLLHSSCVVKNDKAYLFSAPSGTGKSTHTQLWIKRYPDAYILNDDKPAIRICPDGIFAYGTPFSGKTNLNVNKRIPIGGICMLTRGETNHIAKISTDEALFGILNQTVRPDKEEDMDKVLTTLDKIVREIPMYRLSCNMDTEAAEVAYEFMKGNDKNED